MKGKGGNKEMKELLLIIAGYYISQCLFYFMYSRDLEILIKQGTKRALREIYEECRK